MKVNEKLSILFFLSRKRENSESGLAPIYVRITINEDRKEFSSGHQCLVTEWCNKRKISTGKTPDARKANNELTEIKATLLRLYDLLELQGKTVASDMLREAYKRSKGIDEKKPVSKSSGNIAVQSEHTSIKETPKLNASDFDIRKTVEGLSERAKELDREKRNIDRYKHELVRSQRVAQYEKHRDKLQADIEKSLIISIIVI